MAKDERRAKIDAENKFYLELVRHGGQVAAMLNADQLAIWDIFPELHKELFSRSRGWEYQLKSSLDGFYSDHHLTREIAYSGLYLYQQTRCSMKPIMELSELERLLFPLRNLKPEYFLQQVIGLIEGGELEPSGWPEWVDNGKIPLDQKPSLQDRRARYRALYASAKDGAFIHIDDLRKAAPRDFYLQQCCDVWQYYRDLIQEEPLQPTGEHEPDLSPQQSKREAPQPRESTLEKHERYCAIFAEVEAKHSKYSSESDLIRTAADQAGVGESTMRRAIKRKK